MPVTIEDVRKLVEWLGEEGAQAGLEKSTMTTTMLRNILEEMGRQAPIKMRRKDLVVEIIFGATKRIDKTNDDLFIMSSEQLLVYFEEKRPSRAELLKLLGELDFHPGSEAQKSLYKYAARQIAETGMFQRVASSKAR